MTQKNGPKSKTLKKIKKIMSLAPPIKSNLNTASEAFEKNKQAMLEKLDNIEDLLDYVELGGGMHHHQRLAARGKM